MHVAFVISSLRFGAGAGGAQRVVTSLANEWCRRGWLVSIVTYESTASDTFFTLDSDVRVIRLDLFAGSRSLLHGLGSNLRRVVRIRSSMRSLNPDIVISVLDQTNITVIAAMTGLGIPIVSAEFTAPGVHRIGRAWRLLRRLTYGRAALVVAETPRAADTLSFVPRDRQVIIPHFVEVAELPAGPRRRVVCAASRLVPMKRVDWIIRAFAGAVSDGDGWTLEIMGDGPERSALEALAQKTAGKDRVSFTGAIQDVVAHMLVSEIFMLASEYEGFPVALCEAMACGCVPVSVDCPFGPREIVRHQIDGLLVEPGVEALTLALRRLMENGAEREQLREQALTYRERFSKERVMNMWTEVVSNVTAK